MRPDELRQMGDADVNRSLEELLDEFFQLKLRGAYEELEKPSRIRQLRREIARLKTIKRERELAAARDAKEN